MDDKKKDELEKDDSGQKGGQSSDIGQQDPTDQGSVGSMDQEEFDADQRE